MVFSLRHVWCDILRDQKDYTILVHFLSFSFLKQETAPVGFAGKLNCKSSYKKGSECLFLLSRWEQHKQQAGMRRQNRESLKGLKWGTELLQKTGARHGRDETLTLLYYALPGTEGTAGWEQPGRGGGGRQGQDTGMGRRR